MQIQAYLDSRLIQARYVSGIFSHIHNVRYVEAYLPTVGYILADSGIYRILVQLDTFMYISIFRTHGLFKHIQNHRHIQSVSATLFRYCLRSIYTSSELYSDRFRYIQKFGLFGHVNVSRIFRHIHKVTFLVTHIEEYLPMFGHISVDSGIFSVLELPVQRVYTKHLLSRSGFSCK